MPGGRAQHVSHRWQRRAEVRMAQGESKGSCRDRIGSGEGAVTGNVRPLGAAVLKSRQGKAERRIFVLDTNVLMHDPTAIFRFEEPEIYIPRKGREELAAGKKGLSEPAGNVRQVSRFLDELMQGATKKQIGRGLHQLVEKAADLAHVACRFRQAFLSGVE